MNLAVSIFDLDKNSPIVFVQKSVGRGFVLIKVCGFVNY